MPITRSEVVEHLRQIGLGFHLPPGHEQDCLVEFSTQSYVNVRGDRSLLLVIQTQQDGGYLEVFAPMAYRSADSKFRLALFAAMLEVAYLTKHVQIEHDPEDGEIRFATDMPVFDGAVTAMQLNAMVRCLVMTMEEFHPVFAHAMATGKVDMSRRWKRLSESSSPDSDPAPPMVPELARLIEKLGSIEEVEALVAQHRAAIEAER
jgi:hypothetical protein